MVKQPLVVICGPTASGKSALAVGVARSLGGEVVSADSMQVYRGMDIGTAKPAAGERGGIPHHMIDCADPGEPFGAAEYRDRARECIADIQGRGRLPILCGGTGLYISATVYPLDFGNASADMEFRNRMQAVAIEHGNGALHTMLAEADPAAAAAVHPNNVRRVIRALERARLTGLPAAQHRQLFSGEPLYDMAWIGLTMGRDALYGRIETRVDGMMAQGLLDEVRRLAVRHCADCAAFQALGYKELLRHISGEATLEEAITQIKTGTRNYAKRQLTWFRREKAIRWFDTDEFASRDELVTAVTGYIKPSLHIC